MARFCPSLDSFIVEEVPAYLPTGEGEHTFVWIEKRGLTTLDAVNALAARLSISPREIGYAGMKDKHATTRQWLSLPRVAPERAEAAGTDDLRVLRVEKHGNKLRIGHLRGNRFRVTLTDIKDEEEDQHLRARFAELLRDGLPNHYGDQRFGITSQNVTRGIAILRGEAKERDHRRRKLLLSSVQSAVFNEVLSQRLTAGTVRRVLSGDILQKTDSGGVFYTDDPAADQIRLDAGAIVTTGPMPGSWAREPAAGSEARALEDQAMATVGVTREQFSAFGKDLPGTRRPLLVPVTPDALDVGATDPVSTPGALVLSFQLPSGTYATVLVAALGVLVDRPLRAADAATAPSESDAPTAISAEPATPDPEPSVW